MRARANVGWTLLYQLSRLLLTASVGAWVARRLGAADYGQFSTALGWSVLFATFAELGIKSVLSVELARRPRMQPVLTGTAFWLWTGLGVGILAPLGALIHCFYPTGAIFGLTIILASPLLVNGCTVAAAYWDGVGKSGVVSRAALTGMLVGNGVRVIALLLGGGLWSITVVTVMEAWLILGMLWMAFRREAGVSLAWDSSVAASLLRRSLPSFIAQAGNLLLLRMDQIMVQKIKGDVEAGNYGVAGRLADSIYAAGPLLVVIALPALARRAKKQDESFYSLTQALMGLITWTGLSATVFWWLAGPSVIIGLFGSQYQTAPAALAVLSLAAVPLLQGQIRGGLMIAQGWQRYGVACSFVGVAVNLLLNLLWIPKYGALGASWATVASYATAWMLMSLIFAPMRRAGWSQFQAFWSPHHVFTWIREVRGALTEKHPPHPTGK